VVKTTGLISIIAGIILAVAGVATWFVVSSTLADQNITTTSDACLPDRTVKGPFTAFCQADIIQQHTLDITGGKTYAELDRDDPLRDTAMTSSFLRASLFTSVVAFGVAAMAVGMGVLFVFIGFALRKLDPGDEIST
jgi:hypothetical protein